MNNKELLDAKKRQLKALQDEIKQLEGKSSIAGYVTKEFIYEVFCIRENKIPKDIELGTRKTITDSWDLLRKLSQQIFFEKETDGWGGNKHRYHPGKLKIKDMSQEQMKLAARFCDEVIAIYNRYVIEANPTMEFYGKTVTPWDKFDTDKLTR